MIINAYDSTIANNPTPVELGNVVDAVWANAFKSSDERALEAINFFGVEAPTIVDNAATVRMFSFQAGRSFDEPMPIGQALKFFQSHPASVPRLAHIEFNQQDQFIWLRNCGIKKVSLVEKRGALIIFNYDILGGTWTLT